jgi:BirA family transcriptional regulator, biotin operon repressor / biotin---[acetyl-CoA-carboxylase] ligase
MSLPDIARAEEAIARRGGELGRPLQLLDETASTNDVARRAGKLGAPHGSTWVAELQTGGRGRQGRVWFSPRGENLLFSVLLRPGRDALPTPTRLPLVSLVAGLAVAEAVERAAPSASIRIKWPNDVVALRTKKAGSDFAKVAGILVETSMTGDSVDAVVVGVGINVHTRDFPEELAGIATSVACLTAAAPDRAEILADTLAGLDRDVGLVLSRGLGPVHARLAQRDVLLGRRVKSEAGEGIARGIDLEGRLTVERDGRIEAWNAGEVHLV